MNRYQGKFEGIVVENNDPLDLLRLKLRVPAVYGDQVSPWAFPCVPFGGADQVGDFRIPSEGDKVWVEFKGGNPEYPIWVGQFWSRPGGESEVPGGVDDTHRLIQTPGGHKISIIDEDGEQKIKMTTSSGHVIEFNDEPDAEHITITTQGGHKFDMRDETDTSDDQAEGDNQRISVQTALGHIFEMVDVKETEKILFESQGGHSMILSDIIDQEEVIFETSQGHLISMVDISGEEKLKIEDIDGNFIVMDTVNEQMILEMAEILLGDGATEPAVLGEALKTLFNNHKHTGVSTGTEVSGTPETEMSDSELSGTVKVKE